MALSMMFGVAFATLTSRTRVSSVTLGLLYGVALWIVTFYVRSFVSPGVGAMVAHEPVRFAIGTHLVFGMVLGAIVARETKSSQAMA